MTEKEAIERLKNFARETQARQPVSDFERRYNEESIQALNISIAALEKQIPKKPEEYEDKYYACPKCDNILMHKWEKYPEQLNDKKIGLPYCLCCGQAIDWTETE